LKSEKEILLDISKKLGNLIILTKLNNRETLQKTKEVIQNDKVFSNLLDLADGSLSYSELCKQVAKKAKVSERTVKRKILELKEMGALDQKRDGHEVYYENSGLFD